MDGTCARLGVNLRELWLLKSAASASRSRGGLVAETGSDGGLEDYTVAFRLLLS